MPAAIGETRERLRTHIAQTGTTQTIIAQAINVSGGHLSRWLNAKHSAASVTQRIDLYLATATGVPPPPPPMPVDSTPADATPADATAYGDAMTRTRQSKIFNQSTGNASMHGYVYIMYNPADALGLMKIGNAVDPDARLRTFRTSNPLIVLFTSFASTDYIRDEGRIHALLAAYRVTHRGGREWFSCSMKMAVRTCFNVIWCNS